MNLHERVAQAWTVPACVACHRQTMTYRQLAECTGMFTPGVREVLEPTRSTAAPGICCLCIEALSRATAAGSMATATASPAGRWSQRQLLPLAPGILNPVHEFDRP